MSEYSTHEMGISEESYRKFYVATYAKMGIGLLITSIVAFIGYNSLMNGGLFSNLLTGFGGYSLILVCVVQLALAWFFGLRLTHMSGMTAKLCFFIYSAITGVTFSILPFAFDIDTIFMAFAFSAILFINLVIIGMTTKIDIGKFSGIMVAGLITLLICGVISIFVSNPLFTNIYNYLGVLIFMALTAYDAQNLKRYYVESTSDYRLSSNFSSYAAFQLYLDFINLFLRILELLGNSRKRD